MNYRHFLNSDPPGLAQVWRKQSSRSTATYVTPQVLEDFVFSKPYFDNQGLIVAEDQGSIVGFAHAGFGPNEERTDIATDVGTTCLTLVMPEVEFAPITHELIQRSEAYLQTRGAGLLYAGSVYPLNPFYLGFYGGSELPGVVASDRDMVAAYHAAGYEEIDQCVILTCDLTEFRSPIDRKSVRNKRLYTVRRRAPGPPVDWWEACTRPPTEMTVFEIASVDDGQPVGSVTFWLIEPLSTSRQTPIAGLTRLEIDKSLRGQGLATFLNAEALHVLRDAGIRSVEVQTMQANQQAITLYKKLGFREVDQGIILRKPGS